MKTNQPSNSNVLNRGQANLLEPLVKTERILRGLGVCAGIAIGPAHVVDPHHEEVPRHEIAVQLVAGELARFETALEKARRQLTKLKQKTTNLPEEVAQDAGVLLDAHLAMLEGSRLTRGIERRIREQRLNSEAAVRDEIQAQAQAFAALGDDYIAARIADVRAVGDRLVHILLQRKFRAFSTAQPGSIVLAQELTPADTALLDPRQIAGLATEAGGPQGHTAIMARALGLPTVLGVAELLPGVINGDMLIIDGVAGMVIIHPEAETLSEYHRQQASLEQERRTLKRLKRLPAATRDGHEILLRANLDLPRELEAAQEVAAQGIGLLRSEFLYMNREDLPDEEEQYRAFVQVIEAMDGKVVTVRTLDIGGDKMAASLGEHFAPSANPALGLRAIRLSLKEPRLLETQLAAMLRAAARGPLRIMVPMVSNVAEMQEVREVMKNVSKRLKRRGVPYADPLPELGAMIEVPAAALIADVLSQYCDFFSIGTNDLTQYTLAIDRADEQVAELYDPLHPAVLRLIHMTTRAALQARIPVAICGEMAGDPRVTALLLGLGVRELSMTPIKLPLIKRRIRCLDLAAAQLRVRAIMDQPGASAVAELLDSFNQQELQQTLSLNP
jgi:phosphoenolpyruvate-protein phosphotransferase (PTS system enzyme I)